jgi:hypothetical protein
MAPDPAGPAAILARWREAELNATAGPWEVHRSNAAGIRLASDEADWPLAEGFSRAADAGFAAVARTALPLAIGALEAVLKRHQGDVNDDYPDETPVCAECGEWVPCSTVKDITRELTGAAHGQAPERAPCKRIGGCLAEIGARCENPAPDLWKCSCGRTPRDITAALTGMEAGDGE